MKKKVLASKKSSFAKNIFEKLASNGGTTTPKAQMNGNGCAKPIGMIKRK